MVARPESPAGEPARVPHSRPAITPAEVAAVSAVVASGKLATGEEVALFEEELARSVGAAGGVATSSGTAALHLALLALGIGPGDEVVVPAWVCAAVRNAVHHAGATPVVVDVDPATGNIDPAAVRRALTPRTRAVVAVHLSGLPADMPALMELGVPVVEDCAQALGATCAGRPVGGIGSVSVFSFYATKVITAGQGGMLVSRDAALLERVRDLVEYDKRDDYRVRFSCALTDFQAAMGRVQLACLPQFIERRRKLADHYRREGIPDWHGPRDGHIYYRYLVRVRDLAAAASWLGTRGIDAKQPVYRPLHRDVEGCACPTTDAIQASVLSIPLYPGLTDEEARRVAAALREMPGRLLPRPPQV